MNNLELIFGDGCRTDICKVKFGKYLFQGNIYAVNGRTLTVAVPTYYRTGCHIVDVNVNDVIKIKDESKMKK